MNWKDSRYAQNLNKTLISCLDFNPRELSEKEEKAIKNKEDTAFWWVVKGINIEDKRIIDKVIGIKRDCIGRYNCSQGEYVMDACWYDGEKKNMRAEEDNEFINGEFKNLCIDRKIFYIGKFPNEIEIKKNTISRENISKIRAYFYLIKRANELYQIRNN